MNERLRIAFISYAPDPGGVTTYQAMQLEYLAERADVTFIDECPELTMRLLTPQARARVAVLEVPVWSDPRRAAQALACRWAAAPPDLIAMSNPALLVKLMRILLAQRRRGAVLVQTLHSGTLTPTLRRLAAELISALVLVRVHDIVYVSEYTRTYWAGRYAWLRGRGRVVLNGIALADAATTRRTTRSPARIAFVGRLEPEKGIARFLDVARAAGASGREWTFHVFGDGSQRAAVQACEPTVRWHGHVEGQAGIFRETDLLLVTSPVENAPYVVLEAKAAGVPTVATRVGGLSELVVDGEDGIFARSGATADLVAAVENALSRHSLLSAGCIVRRSEFDATQRAEETWGRYTSLTGEQGT